MGLGEAVSEDDGDAGPASKHVRPELWSKERRQEILAHPIFAHPLTKLMGGTLALLLLFIICGGGAASVQVRLACHNSVHIIITIITFTITVWRVHAKSTGNTAFLRSRHAQSLASVLACVVLLRDDILVYCKY